MSKAFSKGGIHKGHQDCAGDRHGPVRFIPRSGDTDPNDDVDNEQYGFCLSCGERVIRQYAHDEKQVFLFRAARVSTWGPWRACNAEDIADGHWLNLEGPAPDRLGYLDDPR